MESNGKPVPGDFIRNCRITDQQAEILNENSMNNGYTWVKEDKPIEPKATKEEAEKGQIDGDQGEKATLWAEIDNLVEAGKINKPHHATGISKLKEIINENQ